MMSNPVPAASWQIVLCEILLSRVTNRQHYDCIWTYREDDAVSRAGCQSKVQFADLICESVILSRQRATIRIVFQRLTSLRIPVYQRTA